MLRELHISNLAVIEDARLELSGGLNCFTGMTGAGKSLVIGAIEILLGLRPPGDMLRRGCAEGRIAGWFSLTDETLRAEVAEALDVPLGVSVAEGEEGLGEEGLLLTRRLFASGRSTVTANGTPVTAGMLKRAAERLIDIHGQHDHQYLLRPANQLEVLDTFAELADLRGQYEGIWSRWRACRRRLEELRAGEAVRRQQLELYRFQAEEIDAAGLEAGEGAKWSARAKLLASTERLRHEAGAVLDALEESEEPIVRRAKWAGSVLGQLSELDPELRNVALAVKEAAVGLQEAAYDLGRYLDRLDVDPEGLAVATERLTLLGKLASKYAGRAGVGEDEAGAVLRYRAWLAEEIAALDGATQDVSALAVEEAALAKEARTLANDLTRRRRAAAARLGSAVEASLAELGMPRARLEVRVEAAEGGEGGEGVGLGPTGADRVEILAATNPGLDPAPLRKIASGGELSRVMLALKGLLSAKGRVSVLVFDEVDANVGGRLGAVIGRRLRELGRGQQVLCITHLPQIACFADKHFTVRKRQTADETVSTVASVEGEERVTELAEMLGGGSTAVASAREMLSEACMTPQVGRRVVTPTSSNEGAVRGAGGRLANRSGPVRSGPRVGGRRRAPR